MPSAPLPVLPHEAQPEHDIDAGFGVFEQSVHFAHVVLRVAVRVENPVARRRRKSAAQRAAIAHVLTVVYDAHLREPPLDLEAQRSFHRKKGRRCRA